MVLIPVGNFQMGDSFGEGWPDEKPVHTVFVSAFYMDKFEVTKALWDEVASWAATTGYDIWPGSVAGKRDDYPVHNVLWYQAAKWANARSEKEGLIPCYYTSGTQQKVYRTGMVDVSVDGVKWSSCGYRLPTEAEWEKAARGGCEGHRFPWCDTDEIQNARANYRGPNPIYATGDYPYTSPVGSFTPNGYGLYDMAGNVWEWVWDWYNEGYYTFSPERDPRGPASGDARVFRGGSWDQEALYCRVAHRYGYLTHCSCSSLGFRLVRTAP
jgi:formylglycine-generating enzyme required for sulfatase activity